MWSFALGVIGGLVAWVIAGSPGIACMIVGGVSLYVGGELDARRRVRDGANLRP